jgi:AcrR family transcriptional regulator
MNRGSITIMARPREITDERMLTAAALVIGRLGPGFTLADVAKEAHVAVGTLARRFGSKHGLLTAMTTAAIDDMRRQMRNASDPVEALVDAYAPLDDPHTAANNLAQLAADLADAELRGLMAEFYSVMEEEVGRLTDPITARILTALADGTALHWSARPDGSLVERLQHDLRTVLTALRTKETR